MSSAKYNRHPFPSRANFRARVYHAAEVLRSGREWDHAFETCFEMHDGDQVGAALLLLAVSDPKLRDALATHFHLAGAAWQRSRDLLAHLLTLDSLAKDAVTQARREIERFAAQRGQPVDLTPEGVQLVIPGCERRADKDGNPPRQLPLF